MHDIEEVMSWVCSIWRRCRGNLIAAVIFIYPKGRLQGRCCVLLRCVVIRGNRHKFDLGYTGRGRKSNPKL